MVIFHSYVAVYQRVTPSLPTDHQLHRSCDCGTDSAASALTQALDPGLAKRRMQLPHRKDMGGSMGLLKMDAL